MISTEDLQITYFQQEPYSKCVDYVAINDSTLFVVHPEMGLMKLTIGFNNWSYADIKQQSTPNNYFEIAGSQINELAYGHGILAATSGYKMYNNGYTDMYLANASINYFENEEWHHISERDILKMPLAGKEFRGITNVACDPSTPHRFYVSTLTTGLYQFDKDSLTQHFLPKTNIKSVHVDDDGILWVAKSLNDSTIWSYDPSSNEWTYHNISDFSQVSNVGRLFRQKYEQHRLIWAVNNYPYRKSRIGILYNTTAIKGNTKDDQSAHFTTFQDQDGNQYSLATTINTVYDIQEDREGKIWLLTNIGPFVVDDVTEAFNYAQQNPGIGLVKRIKVPRNDGTNLADYLLSTTACTALVTDKDLYRCGWCQPQMDRHFR